MLKNTHSPEDLCLLSRKVINGKLHFFCIVHKGGSAFFKIFSSTCEYADQLKVSILVYCLVICNTLNNIKVLFKRYGFDSFEETV